MSCVDAASDSFFELCWEHDAYVLHEMNVLANFCRAGVTVADMRKEMSAACANFQ